MNTKKLDMSWLNPKTNCHLCSKEIKDINSSGYFMSRLSGNIYPDLTKFNLDGERGVYYVICRDCAKSQKEKQRNTATLIKCPDCGNNVSKRATSCPKCGCPISEIIANQTEALQPASLVHNMLKCPTCHSTDIERISTGEKAAYVLGLGILAPAFKKVRSQFECKSCGYIW